MREYSNKKENLVKEVTFIENGEGSDLFNAYVHFFAIKK
jgi:hypothetical protein